MNHVVFIAHGYCFLWRRWIVFREVAGNGMTALAYFSIPFSLLRLSSKLKLPHLANIDPRLRWGLLAFAAFIVSCGLGHVWDIVVIWVPLYEYESWWKVLTGVISAVVAALILPEILRGSGNA